ncbi:MAG: hypothetical protein ACRDRN_08055 [Sciscionella sp.]
MSQLALVLAGLDAVETEMQVIHDQDEAATWGMTGSPTLLIDGIDPFAVPGQLASLRRRLYRDGIRLRGRSYCPWFVLLPL